MSDEIMSTGADSEDMNIQCPICGKKPRGEHCWRVRELTICPNHDEKCKNKNSDNRRKGCDGYLRGSVGYGTLLGNNILVNRYKYIPPKRDEITSNSRKMKDDYKDEYRKKVLAKFLSTFPRMTAKKATAIAKTIVEGTAEEKKALNLPAEDMKKLKAEGISFDKDAKDLRIQHTNAHPLFIGRHSIEAHHLICSDAMDKKWIEICKNTGYNVNCQLNGVYLPSKIGLACYTGIQRHKGSHDLGRGKSEGDPVYSTYVKCVKKELAEISEYYTNEKCKEDTTNDIVVKLNKLSEKICGKIKSFDWTVAWDGLNYQPGATPYIGCAGADGLEKKKDRLKKELLELIDTAGIKWEGDGAYNDMEKIQERLEEKFSKEELEKLDFTCNRKIHEAEIIAYGQGKNKDKLAEIKEYMNIYDVGH